MERSMIRAWDGALAKRRHGTVEGGCKGMEGSEKDPTKAGVTDGDKMVPPLN